MKRRYLACSEPEFLPKAVAKIGRAEILQTLLRRSLNS